MKKLSTIILLLFVLVSCGSSKSTSAPMVNNSMDSQMAKSESSSVKYNDSSRDVVSNQKLIVTYDLSVESKNFDETMKLIEAKVKEYNGYIGNSSVSTRPSYYDETMSRSAYFVIKIPKDKAEGIVSDIQAQTHVTNISKNVNDVTLSYIDTEARLKTLRNQENKYLQLYESTKNMSELLEIEGKLAEVRYQIENYEMTKLNLDQQIDYTSVSINLREVVDLTRIERKPENIFTQFYNAFIGGFVDCMYFIKDFILGLLRIWPLIVIIVGIVVLIRRKIKNRKDKIKF